jgi:hypothetical protein
LVELLNTGGDKEKVKEFLMGIINAANKEAGVEGETPKPAVEGAAGGGKKLGRVPGLGKVDAKAEL